MASRSVNIASALLFMVGIFGVIDALQEIVAANTVDAALMGVTADQIRAFSPNVMDKIVVLHEFSGTYLLGMGLFFVVISLLPFRSGQKWAWYTMLGIGATGLFLQLAISYVGSTVIGSFYFQGAIVMILLWGIGMILPIREFFKKNA